MSTPAPLLVSLSPFLTDRRRRVRTHTACLLRLIRRARRLGAPTLTVARPADALTVALWSLGAFRRETPSGGVWVNKRNGWPVVRDAATLQYRTINPKAPLGEPERFPYPRFVYDRDDETIVSVQ